MRTLATILLLAAALAAPAHAQGTQLLPGVTYTRTVEFTPHGAVVLHVVTAPRPGSQNGLYQLTPVLAGGFVTGGPEPLTQIEQDESAHATVVGLEGDYTAKDGTPSGIFMRGGVLVHTPLSTRSSLGVDTGGTLHVDRVSLFGYWRGTGQRHPLNGLNRTPSAGEQILFTPAYGATVPPVAGSAEAVFASFPAAAPNTDLSAPVTAVGTGGGQAIPPGGAVLVATGANAAALQAEAPVGTQVASRLILQPSWTGVADALGGGPVLVRAGRPVFRSLEDFTNDQVTARSPRAGVGQLADGRVILVAVDGDQPGYSVGLTSFELAQAMVGLGAVTAAAVQPGPAVSLAFAGRLLNRPSVPRGAPVKDALLLEYQGVYAPPASTPLVDGDPGRTQEQLSYTLVRPSTVTAQLVGPGGAVQPLEAAVHHDPGTVPFTVTTFPAEGTWQLAVSATDDVGRTSTATVTFRYDRTLTGAALARPAVGSAAFRFTLTRAVSVRLQVETASGVVVRALPAVSLQPGPGTLVWDGRLPQGTRAWGGTYVAHLFWTSAVGASDLAIPFSFARG